MKSIGSSFTVIGVGVATAFAPHAFAHGDDHGKGAAVNIVKAEQKPFGIAGDVSRVSRTINVDMHDEFRFSPAVINIKVGETIRFRVKNDGNAMHEMVIGTLTDLKKHSALMSKIPGMEHDEPYMAHVKPGATEEIVWNFNRPGEFHYACLIAGHFEAGMIGRAIVK